MAKLLLIEDDPLLIDIYTTKFQQAGFDLIAVDRGEKAIEAIEREQPDAVLLDIVLPHVDGWDILRTLKAADHLQHVKIIVLSNLGQKEEVDKAMELGAARYIIKAHYTPSEIVQEVSKLL